MTPLSHTHHVTILYLLPTRALIADVANRLATPLEQLRVRLVVKTRGPRQLRLAAPRRSPADHARIARRAAGKTTKSLIHVAGVVLDELHVLDGEARGDQLCVVLNRLRQVRAFAVRQGADH